MGILDVVLLLLTVLNLPWVLSASVGHGVHASQLLALHLLHHVVLLSLLLGHEDLGGTLNQKQHYSSEESLLESHRGTTSNGQHTSSDKASHDSVVWVIFLAIGDEEAVT